MLSLQRLIQSVCTSSSSPQTSLRLDFNTWAQFASILRGASALEKLSLRRSGPSGDPREWFIEPTPGSPVDLNAPVQFPHVTDLTLAFHSQARAIGLLHRFYLPALKNLVLEFDQGDYTEFVFELAKPATSLSLLSAQGRPRSLLSNLESLEIARLPCRTECVETFYSELQNLTSLTLSFDLPEVFLSLLRVDLVPRTRRHEIWLPRLVTLYVSDTPTIILRVIVQTRKDAGVPLNSLYVSDSCGVRSEEGVRWLKENLKIFELRDDS